MKDNNSHGTSKETLGVWNDPELEARLVAMLMGELSPFEEAEMEQELESSPELRLFRDRMVKVLGVIAEVNQQGKDDPEQENNDDSWSLSSERRAVLLENFKESKSEALKPETETISTASIQWRNISSIAACFLISLAAFMVVFIRKTEAIFSKESVVTYSAAEEIDVEEDIPTPLEQMKGRYQGIPMSAGKRKSEIEEKSKSQVEGLASEGRDHFYAEDEVVDRMVAKPEMSSETAKKPSAPASSMGKVIAANTPNPTAVPVPGIVPAEPSVNFGDGDVFGAGNGKGDAQREAGNRELAKLEAKITDEKDFVGDPFGDSTEMEVVPLDRNDPRNYTRSSLRPLNDESKGGLKKDQSQIVGEESFYKQQADSDDRITLESGVLNTNTTDIKGWKDTLKNGRQAKDLDSDNLLNSRISSNQEIRYSNTNPQFYGAFDSGNSTEVRRKENDNITGWLLADSVDTVLPTRNGQLGEEEISGERIEELLDSSNKPDSTKNEISLTIEKKFKSSEDLDKYKERGGSRVDALKHRDIEKSLTKKSTPDFTKETSAAQQTHSTFSLNVSDVSFQLAKTLLLEKGGVPEADKIRVEEFVNAFDYGDPSAGDKKVNCVVEQCAHPFYQQRNLVRVGMKTGAIGRSQPLRLTVLLDNSGSMERADRAATVVKAMEALASQLGPQDEVTLMSFARDARLIAQKVKGNEANKLVDMVRAMPSEGGTNLSKSIEQAYRVAQQSVQKGTMSRIVLITDGAANLGNADPEDLSKSIEQMRQNGIAFDACGVGADGLDDDMLEALTRKGDGRYYFINRPEDADEGFAQKLAGALRPAAKNVKVQVVFNPERVGNYRLIGFEKHRLEKEDFRNDKVDAAEMAAEEAGNALYQVEAKPDGNGDVATVFVRFRDMASGQMVERSWTIPYQSNVTSVASAAPSMQLATVAGMLGERLKLGDQAGIDLKELKQVYSKLRSHFYNDQDVQDLIRMCEKVNQ